MQREEVSQAKCEVTRARYLEPTPANMGHIRRGRDNLRIPGV